MLVDRASFGKGDAEREGGVAELAPAAAVEEATDSANADAESKPWSEGVCKFRRRQAVAAHIPDGDAEGEKEAALKGEPAVPDLEPVEDGGRACLRFCATRAETRRR